MKNAIPPTLAPRISRSAQEEHLHQERSQAAYHANNSDDNFDQIIQEDRNLHIHERNNKIAAPSPQGTNISHRATTPTKMAAKMQATSPTTPTSLTTTDDNKKGTTTEPEHETTKHYASTNVAYKDIGPTDDNEEDNNSNNRTTITTATNLSKCTNFNNMEPHSTTDIADANAAIQTPPQELTLPPTVPSKRRHRARRFYPRRRPRTSRPQIDPYDDPTSLQYLSRDILDLIDDAFSNSSFRLLLRSDNEGDSRPSSLVRTAQHAPTSDHHFSHYHNNLKLDIIDMAHYVCTIHMFTEDEEPIKASYSLGTIQTRR
ncbi:hypothetical protein MHU86_21620 [Fragilaria crotonensis]|nr:hypothetical protein MHU86_21620 [Fragilaria crotonensis]